MQDRDRWDDLPLPDEAKQYISLVNTRTREERATMLRFAPVLCTCQPWYDHSDPAPAQAGCFIHTTILIDPAGDWL